MQFHIILLYYDSMKRRGQFVLVALNLILTVSKMTSFKQLEFLSEAETMKIFEHENIVKLLGVCTKGEPAFAIMELMIHGELHFVALLKARILTTITIK